MVASLLHPFCIRSWLLSCISFLAGDVISIVLFDVYAEIAVIPICLVLLDSSDTGLADLISNLV